MIKIRRIFVLFILILSTGFISAQQKFSLEDCRQMAIENNKTLKSASERQRATYFQKKEALLKFFPKISAEGSYMHSGKDLHLIGKSSIPSLIPIPPALASIIGTPAIPISQTTQNAIYDAGRIDLSDFWIGEVSLTQPLFYGGRIIANYDIRKYAEELTRTQKESKMTDIIVEVDETYWQIVSLVNKQKLAESYVASLTKVDSDIQQMLEEGVATKADRLSVSVRLNEAEMALTRAINGVSLSKMLLCQLCGIEVTDKIIIADENLSEIQLDNSDPIYIDTDEAIANRKEIKSLELVSKIYKKQEKIAFAEYLPTAGISVGYLTTKPNFFNGKEPKFSGMWNVGIKVTVPLNFLTNTTKLNTAKAQTRASIYELEDTKEKIRLEVSQQTYKLAESNKKLIMASTNTEKANENLRYANTGFEEGVISASDVLQAHTAWLSAHAEKIDAQIDVKLCRIYLNKALGRD